MIEKRKFHRAHLSTNTVLCNNDVFHKGQLENISMNGALIRLEHGTFLPQGSEYSLTVQIDGEEDPLQLMAKVVCVPFAMAGLKFVSYEADTKTRLAKLMEKLSSEPDAAMAEHERVRRQLAEYLCEE